MVVCDNPILPGGFLYLSLRWVCVSPAIGLVICQSAGREEVRYALGGLEEKVFVAEYRVKLPSETEIVEALRQAGDE